MRKKISNSAIRPSVLDTMLNDINLEERVAALELQMANVQEEIVNVSDDKDEVK